MSTKGSPKSFHVSTDEVFELLGEKRRRDLLTVLCSQTSPVTLFALASELSRCDEDNDGLVDEEIVVMLHHVDLPKLDDADLLTYDNSLQLVMFDSLAAGVGSAVEEIESALRPVRDAI
ncbi:MULTISPECIES: hypothetical protein [Haloferax]|uniref:DUF7344 domain-containing protein n=2 Tax=Haloferax TaxID=2251 RepID=A0A6G1Z0B3_9EURY|nr:MULTISPECIES: hypothetical protein [Haloferax]KAB1187236.1 hypothetical protein Hfx1149_04010 [Haloferax sp. CBA1149]MRW79878.1 hypothetical protein [Haloferax marinisediminis]